MPLTHLSKMSSPASEFNVTSSKEKPTASDSLMKVTKEATGPFLSGVMQGFAHVAVKRVREWREERRKVREEAAAATATTVAAAAAEEIEKAEI